MHLGITEKPTRDCMHTPVITLALSLSPVMFPKKITENAENYRCRQPQCHLTSLLRNPANIRIHFIFPETRVIFAADSHSIYCGGLRNTHFSARVRIGRLRSSKVIDFGMNRKYACNFLLVCHSNLGPILPRLRDIAGFLLIDTDG